MGLSAFSISMVKYSANQIQILYHRSDKNLGARHMDMMLLKAIVKELEDEEDAEAVLKKPKSVIRLLQEMEKYRKQLTSNDTVDISIDEVIND